MADARSLPPPNDDRALVRALRDLAGPAIATSVLQTAVFAVDRVGAQAEVPRQRWGAAFDGSVLHGGVQPEHAVEEERLGELACHSCSNGFAPR